MEKTQPLPQIIPNGTTPLSIFNMDQVLNKDLSKVKTHQEIKIVYFGTPQFSAYILEKLIEFCQNPSQVLSLHPKGGSTNLPKQFTIQTVITRADKPVGRKQVLMESPVAMVAHKYNIPVLKPIKLNEDFLTSHLSLLTCDLNLVASYGKIIPQTLLDMAILGALNVHPSLLPKYRGPSPILTPILNGDQETGVTIMLMDEQMDHGPILNTKQVSISSQDNHQTLTTKLAQVSTPLLIETLVKFVEGKLTPKPQNHLEATYTKMTQKQDGYFDINNPPAPEVLDKMIRAYYPWPTAWTKWQGKIVKFLPYHSEPAQESNFLIQMEGKKPQTIKDFLNGYPNFPGWMKLLLRG